MKLVLILAAALSLAAGLTATVSDSASTAAAPEAPNQQPEIAVIVGPCLIHLGCEAEADCRKVNSSCTLTLDSGENSCRLAPGETFDCPPSKTIHVETCDCTGSGCSVATGTYLTCA